VRGQISLVDPGTYITDDLTSGLRRFPWVTALSDVPAVKAAAGIDSDARMQRVKLRTG